VFKFGAANAQDRHVYSSLEHEMHRKSMCIQAQDRHVFCIKERHLYRKGTSVFKVRALIA
jgi:hypothetical protein